MSARTIKGFTLIELMITVAIVAILAAVAYPAYTEYIRKGRRAEAKSELANAAQFMERYFTEKMTYVGAALPVTQIPASGSKYYDLALSGTSTTAYTIQATPTTGGSQENDKCGVLSINQTGQKSATLSGTAVTGCW